MEKVKDRQPEKIEKTGAVMVVGGGVGGMQAALDLANSGFKVYLVEETTAIGGRMAQLDKTFPTNDCSMCTISPKLVETGRHLNIQLMMDSEVMKVDGQAGNFTVTVRHKPRYIDISKCTGCSECAQVCPIIMPSRFDEGMAQQRAAYKLYPQAVPNAYAIEKRGIAPCRDACPTGQRAQGYIALIREGRYEDAMRVIKEDNPFPGICGRICNHRCEDDCNRNLVDQPLSIATLKRFVADQVYSQPYLPPDPLPYQYRGEGGHHRRRTLRADRGQRFAQTGIPGHHLRGPAPRRGDAPGRGSRLPSAPADRGPGGAGDHRPGDRPAAQHARDQPG